MYIFIQHKRPRPGQDRTRPASSLPPSPNITPFNFIIPTSLITPSLDSSTMK